MKNKYTWRILGLVACLLFAFVTVSCHKEKEITEEQARIVIENAQRVDDAVSSIFMSAESVEEMALHLDEIKAMENVEDARQGDNSILIKIKDGGIISYDFFPNYSVKSHDINSKEHSIVSNTKEGVSVCENKSLCVVNAVPYDENVNFIKDDLQIVANQLKGKGYSVRFVEGEDVNEDFICKDMPDYGVIVFQAHGQFEDGQHWIITGNSNGLSYGRWAFQYIFREWLSDLKRVSISKEKRNGKTKEYYYWKISEQYIQENLKNNFPNNSVMFAISCDLLKGNTSLWGVLQDKDLGCFFGYDNPVRAEVGASALSSVMNSMLNGKTASEAYRVVPTSGRYDNDTKANLVLCPANSDITLVEKPDYGDDWVDLGLPSGLLWATRNVGASSPEDYGDYFAWGETTPKEEYYWDTYRYCNGSDNTLTKYCTKSNYGYNGFHDTLTILQPGDDAATANYGGRTPTNDEWRELKENTTHKWMTINEVNGLRFTGTNGNSLFLPAAGYYRLRYLFADNDYGYYWSNSLHEINPTAAEGYEIFDFYYYEQGEIYYYGGQEDVKSREIGLPVRAVRSTR